MLRLIVHFVCAVLSVYVIAVLLVGQFNIANISAMGIDVSVGERLSTFTHDIINMLSLYLPIIAVAMLIGLLVGGQVFVRWFEKPHIFYPLAGFVAIATVHLALKAVFEVSAIAPTATTLGFLSQCFAGLIGGYVFYRLRAKSQD